MHLHSVIPLVPLLGLVHFRIPLAFLVLGGRRGVDNGRIRNLLLQEIDSYDLLLEMPNKSVFP